jgi:alpha-glucuronidase
MLKFLLCSGVIAEYSAKVQKLYLDFRNPESEAHALLWRELPYTYTLNNGKTIAEGVCYNCRKRTYAIHLNTHNDRHTSSS